MPEHEARNKRDKIEKITLVVCVERYHKNTTYTLHCILGISSMFRGIALYLQYIRTGSLMLLICYLFII